MVLLHRKKKKKKKASLQSIPIFLLHLQTFRIMCIMGKAPVRGPSEAMLKATTIRVSAEPLQELECMYPPLLKQVSISGQNKHILVKGDTITQTQVCFPP